MMSVPTRRHALLGGAAFTLGLGGILLPGSALACLGDSGSTSTSSNTSSTVSDPQTGSRGDAGPPPGGSSDIPGSTGLWNPVQGINIPALSPTTTHNVSNASQLAAAINTINTTSAAGHHIVLADGSYSGNYTIYAQGTQSTPIVIRPSTFLGATLTGTLTICGSWVIVRGLNTRMVQFSAVTVESTTYRANNSRISRCILSNASTLITLDEGASYCCLDRNEVIGGVGHAINLRPRPGVRNTFRNCIVWNLVRDNLDTEGRVARQPTIQINGGGYSEVNNEYEFLFGWNRIQGGNNRSTVQIKGSGNTVVYNTIANSPVYGVSNRHGRRCYTGGNWFVDTNVQINVRGEGHQIIGNRGRIQIRPGNIEGGSADEPSWSPSTNGPGYTFAEDAKIIGNSGALIVNGPESDKPYAPLRTLIENHTGSITISAQSRQTIDRRNSSSSQVVPVAYLLQASQVGPYS